MALEYEIDEKDDFAIVTAKGEMGTLEQMLEYAAALTQDVIERGLRKVLVDNRNVNSLNLSFFDQYDFVTQASQTSEPRTIKWAVVVGPERTQVLKDFETLVRNRGYTFLGFDSFSQAEEWLCE